MHMFCLGKWRTYKNFTVCMMIVCLVWIKVVNMIMATANEPKLFLVYIQLGESKPPTVVDVLTMQEDNPAYYPSFEDRMAIDIVAVTCTVIEMCCWRQLRAAMPASSSLLQRVATIRKLLKNGQLQLKR